MLIVPIDKANYIAGIVDGEGHIGLVRGKVKSGLFWSYTPRIYVSNTNMQLLSWLKLITGIGSIDPTDRYNVRCKIAFRWNLKVHEMQDFLELIQPHLIVKLEQCLLLLEFLDNRSIKGQIQTEEQRRLCSLIHSELADLNHRGI